MNRARSGFACRISGRLGTVSLLLTLQQLGPAPLRPYARAEPADRSGAAPLASTDQDAASEARVFFDIGAQAYEQGDYDGALEAFHEAYARSERSGLLFSIAQAHRRAYLTTHDPAELSSALEHYRKYLASGDQAGRRVAQDALEKLVALSGDSRRENNGGVATASTGKLMIASSTPGAVLRVDGLLAPHLPFVAAVAPGTHRVELTAPGFREQVRELPVPAGAAFALDLALEELPGSVAVLGEADSQLWIDGRLVGALPLPPLALKAGTHQVSLRQRGHRIATRRLALERGAAAHVDLRLVPTTQRKVSIALLWGGAALAVAGAATAITAYARQRTALRLQDRLKQGEELQTSDRSGYEEARTARDRLRNAAVGLCAGGVGALALGGVLFAVDNPQTPALLEPAPDDRAPPRNKIATELIAGPTWDDDRVGVEVRGRF